METGTKDPDSFVIVKELGEVTRFITDYETQNNLKYIIRKTDGAFRDTDEKGDSNVNWEKKRVTFDKENYPCSQLGTRFYECRHGPDHHTAKKERYKRQREELRKQDHAFVKNRVNLQPSAKAGCPARIVVRKLRRYTEYKMEKNTKIFREKTSKALREQDSPAIFCDVYEIVISPLDTHKGHLMGEVAEIIQPVDDRIKAHISHQVDLGVYSLAEMRRNIKSFVVSHIDESISQLNSRFYPSDQTIKNHIQLSLAQTYYSSKDQENIESMIEKNWREEGNFKFQRSTEAEKFLFVHQTSHQKRLMERYGKELCLLDATHRTTKYALFMFFVVVKTNVDYQVVATFITESEAREDIARALGIIKQWNADWLPSFWLTDYSQAEIAALEDMFPDTKVLLRDFHREQAWIRQLKRKEMGLHQEKQEVNVVLALLRRIARANTLEQHRQAIKDLQEHDLWTGKSKRKLREYICNYWLDDSMKQRWACCFRKDRILTNVNTNNGIERMNGVFKKSFLANRKSNKLSMTIRILVEQFSPYLYKRYCEANIKMSALAKPYDISVPAELCNRPHDMVTQCITNMHLSESIHATQIKQMSQNEFVVSGRNGACNVDILRPTCECFSWVSSSYPCKHMYAVCKYYSLEIPKEYMNNPWFTIDEIFSSAPREIVSSEFMTPSLSSSSLESVSSPVEVDDGEINEIPTRKRQPGSLVAQIQESTKILVNAAFQVTDNDLLCTVVKSLQQLTLQLENSMKKDDGLILNQEKTSKKPVKRKSRSNQMMKQEDESIIPSKKSSAQACDIKGERHLLEKLHDNSSEQSSETETDGVVRTRRFLGTASYTKKLILPMAEKDAVVNQRKSGPIRQLAVRRSRLRYAGRVGSKAESYQVKIDVNALPRCKSFPNKTKEKVATDDELFSINWTPASNIEKRSLTDKFVDRHEWLTSDEMDKAMQLITKQWPDVQTQSSLLIQRPKHFEPATNCGYGDYCQVLHMASANHWIAVTNIGGKGSVRLFDSLGLTVPHKIKRAIASLEKSPGDSMAISVEPVQRQTGGSDCGFFAIAFLVEVLHGGDPKTAAFHQSQLRQHFCQCLSEGYWSPFPKSCEEVSRVTSRSMKIKLYCSCRMPHHQTDLEKDDMWMVECSYCQEWYHRQCIKATSIDLDVFGKLDKSQYLCTRCKDNGRGFSGW